MDVDEDWYSALTETTSTIKKHEDKPPHDASIFVGSLPSNIDQGDLTRLLTEHLSEHTQIKSVKVVRDSKGGVCAFVQCLDASSATTLIDTLYSSPPKPFLGRILRYEPARAFRMLLISYRTPTHLVQPVAYTPCKDREIELDLPTAMLIWKHRNSRFHNIQYNEDALQAEDKRERAGTGTLDAESVFLHPMKYDEEAIRKLVTFFGSLESFGVLENAGDRQTSPYPVPHNGPRSSVMDPKCWEVKWRHRDDCVNALMTLRRVPHLTVTWAHQSFQTQFRYPPGSPYSPNSLHFVRTPYMWQGGVTPHVRSHINGYTPVVRADHQNIRPQCGHYSQSSRKVIYPHLSKVLTGERRTGGSLQPTVPMSSFQPQKIKGPVSVAISSSGDGNPAGGAENQELSASPDAEAQELYMPHCPGPDSTSITPVTPESQFPITLTTSGASYDGFGANDGGKASGIQKKFDPTTLFVGGLETSGPNAWDEAKVRQLFARFGGLESVKFVRPANATAAFAFVKFNNAESPARAVCEEHNRVYEGRTLRVQLRDINPPKNTWKFGRGRGRVPQHHFDFQRRFNHQSFTDGQDYAPGLHQEERDHPVREAGLESSISGSLPNTYNRSESLPTINPAKTPSSTAELGDTSGTERYREWYDELESPSHTTASSSLGSSASATGVSCTVPSYSYIPNGPYFPPPPWMVPYMPQGPYPVPYYSGYALIPPPPQQPPTLISPTSSDASGSAVGSHPVWPTMGVYGSFVPYPVFPPRPPTIEQAAQTHIAAQAPMTPSGFIQNEQGALVAVYQPEAMNRYMGSGNDQSTVDSQEGIGQKYIGYTPRPYNQETLQPPVVQHASTCPGQPGVVGFAGGAPRRIPDLRHSPMPFRGGAPNVNPPLNPMFRRSHSARNQSTGFPRMFPARPGSEYLHNTDSDHGRRGGQTGRPFGDWN